MILLHRAPSLLPVSIIKNLASLKIHTSTKSSIMEPPPAKLRRHENRAAYDLDSASSIFSDCFMAHVSYIDKGLPQCLPMIALLATFEDEPAVYLHGHPTSRLMELVKQWTKDNESKSSETEKEDEDDSFRVCVTATKSTTSTLISSSS